MIEIKLGKTWNNGTRNFGGSRLLERRIKFEEDGRGGYTEVETARYQCCIGVAMTQLGVPDKKIKAAYYANHMRDKDIPEVLKWLVDPTGKGNGRDGRITDDGSRIYGANDDAWVNCPKTGPKTSDEERVKALNEISEPHGIKFVLVND